MAEPTVQVSADGATVTITCSRLQAKAVAASIQQNLLEDAQPVLRAVVGDPPWQRDSGEGVDGAISRSEYNEYLQSQGLPVPT